MSKCTKETQFIKEESTWSVLEQVAREGARKMLQLAVGKPGLKRQKLCIRAISDCFEKSYLLAR